jgi:predicted transcriptional regulator of viral defense system
MTKPLNGHVLSSALDTLVTRPLNQADDAALVSAAKAVWYSDSNLESEITAFLNRHTDEVEVRRAGYLLERFTRFTCLSDLRVSETLNVLELFAHSTSRQVATLQTVTPLRRRRDELAVSWGLSEGLGLKVQTLMPFQTRHYEAEQRAMFS